jgi:hypothetical protein
MKISIWKFGSLLRLSRCDRRLWVFFSYKYLISVYFLRRVVLGQNWSLPPPPSWYHHTLLQRGVPRRIRCVHYPQGLCILVCPGLECGWPSSNACRLSLGIVMMSKAPGGDGNPTAKQLIPVYNCRLLVMCRICI